MTTAGASAVAGCGSMPSERAWGAMLTLPRADAGEVDRGLVR